ncbi:helix-turn-helix domain-containing protein [Brachybacterium sp. AOP43-C2-M15]|uniref:helix-turn-helix domain-containing protein n=1 Tax=Brachybacterium sp. AOP43-C2-M15 TaxID=3457661 RepID=UPI004034B15C
MTETDPLRRLLDAVLEADGASLEEMAAGAHLSPFHFQRTVRRRAGETPSAMRRRVRLERAAWSLQGGAAVTEVAFAAGYDSVEGFSRAFRRAFGCAPSDLPSRAERGHWLPAPNGIHFHSPTTLYVDAGRARESSSGDVLTLLVQHDLDDVDVLLTAAAEVGEDAYRAMRLPGSRPRGFDGPDETLAQVMRHLVLSREPWLASIAGEGEPDLSGPDDPASLAARHRRTAPRWLAMLRDVDRRGAWQDAIVDALCDPPESFLLSQILAHELTYSTHRRQLARWMLADAGLDTTAAHLDPDPILWHRRRTGEQP